MELLEEKSFLEKISPFNQLDNSCINKLISNFDIIYFKKDETVIEASKSSQYLYFIIKGVIHEMSGDDLVSVYTKNEFFDAITLIENRAKNSFIAKEETIAYTIQRDIFLDVLYKNELLEEYFFASIADKLNLKKERLQQSKLFDFAIAKVEDIYLQKPLYIDASESIAKGAKLLKDENCETLLVRKSDKIGIVTYSDFVKKAIAMGLDFSEQIEKITTFNLITIDKSDFLFNAQLLMSEHNIERLVVTDEKEIVGVLDLISLNSFFAAHSYLIHKRIDNAKNLNDLKEASSKVLDTIKILYEKDIKARYIAKLVSQLNEKLISKLFTLTAPKDILNSSSLIIMGSEGRGEQILKTDQDNALILEDNCNISSEELSKFTTKFTQDLIELGYPPCPGNIMLSNPYWCRESSDFKELIYSWINKPQPESLMHLAIFLDAKTVIGNEKLLNDLKLYLLKSSTSNLSILANFAKATLQFETPLGFFSNFIVDKSEHKGKLDIKKGAIFPIVHGIRSLAFEQKIDDTNTFARIKKLVELNILNKEFAKDLTESFDFLLKLRLRFRLEQLEQNLETNNYIDPNSLSSLEKDLLKDSFKVVNEFKKLITHHFKLNYV